MECVRIGDGEVECVLTVTERLSNTYGTMHGGAISTCIDVLGSMALLTKDHTREGVSVDMNMTFCAAARVGETLCLTGSVPTPVSSSLCFLALISHSLFT